MYKISSQVIDYYDDERMIIEFECHMPDYVKTASLLDCDDIIRKLDDDYAVIMMTKTGSKIKRYPTFDKPHTWLSCQAFLKTAGKLPACAAETAASNLFSSCLYHDIDCPSLISKMAANIDSNTVNINEDKDLPLDYHINSELMKKAAANVKPGEYGLTIKTASGSRGLYPLNNRTNVELAIEYFDANKSKLLPGVKCEFATNICKHASRLNVDVPGGISIYTNKEKGNRVSFNINSRMMFAKTSEDKEFLKSLQNKCAGMSKDELIDYLSEFDKIAGLGRYWGSRLNDPYVSILEKSAENYFEVGDNLSSMKLNPGNGSNIKNEDIKAYANGSASVELISRLPDDVVNEFLTEPVETYKEMPDIQKKVIIDGVTGNL